MHFFLYRELPHLALCISWRMPEVKRSGGPRGRNEAWRKRLETPEEEERFERLRRWRAEKARAEGIPAYAIMTNLQLAETAHRHPASLSALMRIEGFGPAKAEKFGREILELLGVS